MSICSQRLGRGSGFGSAFIRRATGGRGQPSPAKFRSAAQWIRRKAAPVAAAVAARPRSRPTSPTASPVLCRAGDGGDSLYLVERGLLHVLDGNTAALLGRQRAGDVVGEVALLTGEPRSATLLARVPSAVSELSREAFLAVAARHPV